MTKYKLLNLFIVFSLTMSSCFKDMGNYEYVDINEITISELGGPYNLLFKVDTLKIEPKLDFTMDTNDPNRYTYEWRIAKVGVSNAVRTVIGKERNLAYHVSAVPDKYTLFLNIHDKETDVLWTGATSFEVSTAVARGFLLSGEDEEGFAEVDMISMPVNSDTMTVKNLLKDNGMPRYRKPIRVMHTGSVPENLQSSVKLWFMSEEGAYFMNSTNFQGDPSNTFKNRLFTTFNIPLDSYPVVLAPMTSASGLAIPLGYYSRVVLTNNGDLFLANIMNGGDIYGNPVNRIGANSLDLVKLAPFILYTPGMWSKFMVYDIDNNRFLMGTAGNVPSKSVTNLVDGPGALAGPFPWNQGETGRKLHYAENTKNRDNGAIYGNSYALMKDNEENFHIYKMYVNNIGYKYGYFKIKPIAQDFAQASHYGFSSLGTFIFYSVGSKLYAYDFNLGLEKSYLVKDFGEEITMLMFDIEEGLGDKLYVATYSRENKGTIHKYKMGSNLNNLTMTKDEHVNWTGLLKVKSMAWRSSVQ